MTSPVRAAQPWAPQAWDATGARASADTDALFVEKFPAMRLISWIWHVRGSVPLMPGQSGDDAFDKLAPLFRETGTTHKRNGDTLTFDKKDQPAQDKMSVFDHGVLRIEKGAAGSVLRYHLISRSLLFCFFLPLFFLAFAQMTIALGKHQKASAETTAAAGKAPNATHKPAAKAAPLQLNPIDKFLGAPAPEKPKDGEEMGRRGKKPSPTPAYVFASFFAILYVFGRIFEDWLIKRRFRRMLSGE